jgi:hypothetical protein
MTALPPGYPTEAFAAFDFLKSRRELSITDLQVLALIESYGEVFYRILASGVEHAEARTLLTRNAQEERGHAHRILKAIELKGGEPFALPPIEENPFMQFAPVSVPCNAEMLALLEKGEVDGDLQYQTWADTESDPIVAAIYRLNGREETRHSERVVRAKALLLAA